MDIMNYVKPELIVVSAVLYIVGMSLKKVKVLKDSTIPFILGGIGILMSAVWVIANSQFGTVQEILMAIFTSIVQGILVAGLSTYVNQLIKQTKK